MKTPEMINVLMQRKAKFKSDKYSGMYDIKTNAPINYAVADKQNLIITDVEGKEAPLELQREWEEVKQPVTWQEAIQAWIDGKSFRVEYNGYVLRQDSLKALGSLDNEKRMFLRENFNHGKWYIED